MRITGLILWLVPLTSHATYYMADGKTCETVETAVLRVDTDAGFSGWGEVCPIPHYLPAYARGVAPALQELAPVLIGADLHGPEQLMAQADAWLVDHRYAKSALDIALWDLMGQAAGMPLHALLGGKRQDRLPLYHSITCVAPDEMARIARAAQASPSFRPSWVPMMTGRPMWNVCALSALPWGRALWSTATGTAARMR